MRTEELAYNLPESLIARRPPERRDGGRLMVLEAERLRHLHVADFPDQLESADLLVLNDTRVYPARLIGRREPQGGKVEILLLRRLDGALNSIAADGRERWQALGRASRALRSGTAIAAGGLRIEVLERLAEGELMLAIQSDQRVVDALEEIGRVPIPPYLGRQDDAEDRHRYQSVFATTTGSVAAPTASLHLTDQLLQRIRQHGVRVGRLTLHIGLDTFRPVKVEDLSQHRMHSESVFVGERLCAQVAETRARGGRVVAVGTTAVRALETAADPQRPGYLVPWASPTALFIQPGYPLRIVDALLTNFHLPRSSLLALVAAFVGVDRLLTAYNIAVDAEYRFLSYGDAMWIPRRQL